MLGCIGSSISLASLGSVGVLSWPTPVLRQTVHQTLLSSRGPSGRWETQLSVKWFYPGSRDTTQHNRTANEDILNLSNTEIVLLCFFFYNSLLLWSLYVLFSLCLWGVLIVNLCDISHPMEIHPKTWIMLFLRFQTLQPVLLNINNVLMLKTREPINDLWCHQERKLLIPLLIPCSSHSSSHSSSPPRPLLIPLLIPLLVPLLIPLLNPLIPPHSSHSSSHSSHSQLATSP